MTGIPETPADCVQGIALTGLQRSLIIKRIELLINQRVSVAVIAAIEQTHAAAMRHLTAPITAAEVDKASAVDRPARATEAEAPAVDPELIGYRPNNDFGDLDSGLRDHDEF